MAKLSLNSITSGYASNTAVNTNNDLIETALENTLSRDGTYPNTMNANLDMNGFRILNELAQTGEGFIWQGPWVTSTSYVLNNLVSNSGATYICLTAHTSGTFATDLAASKWQLLADKGATGAGTGDMVVANNLSELTATASTARGNILAAKSGTNTDITSLNAPTIGAATATTATTGNSSTLVATTAFVAGAISSIGGRTVVSLASDVPSTASTSYQDVTNLSFSVTAGTIYRFRIIIDFTVSSTSIGARFALNGPATTRLAYHCINAFNGSTGNQANSMAVSYDASWDTGTPSESSFTGGNIATITGTITPSASGTVIVRFAPETATANGVVIKAGSCIEVW